MISRVRSAVFLMAGLAGAGLILAGMNSYPGSKLTYLLFCVSFWLMLLTSFNKRTHYGYLFLVVALWLGFWGKITAHLILDYPYVEPIGQFDGSAAAWDDVLWVAIGASAGVMLGKLLFILMGKKYSRVLGRDQAKVPRWYPAIRSWVWPFSLAVIVSIAAMNSILGIQQIGLVPRTILPWPLNALIAWQVSIGSALLLTVLLWWEVSLKKSISVSIYALLLEAIISTATLLSRGVYIFHTIPQLFSLFENRQRLVLGSKIKVIALILVFIGLMGLSISGVTTLRAYLYPHTGGFTTEDQKRLTRMEVIKGGIARVKILILQGEPQEGHLRELLAEKAQLEKILSKNEAKSDVVVAAQKKDKGKNVASAILDSDSLLEGKSKLLSEFYSQIGSGTLPRILSLAVDRWIGLEGVMAVSAYPGKSSTLLFDAVKEKREIGKTTKFQDICNSHYRWVDAENWQFASLPGAAAFLYLSGSLWVVMLGMVMFAFLLQLGEQLVFTLTSNPLLCSLLGLTLANSVAQFGITPRQDIPFYSMIFGFLLVVFLVQSDKICAMIRKFVSHRGERDAV